MMNEKEISALFRRHGLRASSQRIAIYRYMIENHNHPSAEMVFDAFRDDSEVSISLATVYNCLHDFVKAGLAREILVENEQLRYDADLSLHGHFRCDCCGKVFDFPIDMQKLRVDFLPDNFEIARSDFIVFGRCPHCRGNGN